MSIPLPLGMPPSREEPRGLLDALLARRHDTMDSALESSGQALAAPIVPATSVIAIPGRDIVVELDVSAEAPSPAGRRPVRYQLDCSPDDLDDVLAFTAPAPLAVYVQVDDPVLADAALADTARALTEAGTFQGCRPATVRAPWRISSPCSHTPTPASSPVQKQPPTCLRCSPARRRH